MPNDNQSSAPAFEVTVGSEQFTQPNSNGLRSVMVEDHVDMSNLCTIILGTSSEDPNFGFKIGEKVEVKMKTSDHALFKGEVVSIDHSFQINGTSSMILRCVDQTHRLGRGLKTRFWNDKTDDQVAQEVASESDLSVEVDTTEEQRSYILQRNESNIAFLKRLAARNNFQVRVDEDKLYFKKADYQGQVSKVEMGSNIVSLNTSFNSMGMVQKVVVQGWSIKDKKEVIGTCEASSLTKIGGGNLGTDDSQVFGESTKYITDIPVSSQKIANQIAEAEMARIARQFCRGKCSMRGDNFIRAGTVVELSGFSEGLNGKYYVISSRHSINPKTGHVTDFTFCSNTFGN